ncbi:MAG: glycoside hydrolase family 57 protein [Planctomycetota bacterium]
MTAVVLYLQAHQPYRLRRATPSGTADPFDLFDREANAAITDRVAQRCYRPMAERLMRLARAHEGRFRCAVSLSGTLLQQLADRAPDVLDRYVELANTGCLEILAETSHHSLASVAHAEEFEHQVRQHRTAVAARFGAPRTFRNTELILDETVAATVERLGFVAILGEGAERLLGTRPPGHRYRPHGCRTLAALLRCHELSDDLAFRFADPSWPPHPLDPGTFADWLQTAGHSMDYVGLFMDIEAFGEHHDDDATGIGDFLDGMVAAVLRRDDLHFATPAEVATGPAHPLTIPHPVSWADTERDLSAWLGNPMQRTAHDALYSLYRPVMISGRDDLPEVWRRLSTSDHFYYMATKTWTDGYVHQALSPFPGPVEAFACYMRALVTLRAWLADEPSE